MHSITIAAFWSIVQRKHAQVRAASVSCTRYRLALVQSSFQNMMRSYSKPTYSQQAERTAPEPILFIDSSCFRLADSTVAQSQGRAA